MIIPAGLPTFSEALRCGAEIFHALKKIMNAHGMSTAVGDEGGFAPNIDSHEAAIEFIIDAIKAAATHRESRFLSVWTALPANSMKTAFTTRRVRA